VIKHFSDHDSAVAHIKETKPDVSDPDAFVATIERKQSGSLLTNFNRQKLLMSAMIIKTGGIGHEEDYDGLEGIRKRKAAFPPANISLIDKKKKKSNIHLLLNTKIGSMINQMQINGMKLKLKKAVLEPMDELVLTRLMKKLNDTEMTKRRDELTTQFQLRQDVGRRLVEDPDNNIIKNEMESKDQHLTFMIQDILRSDKEVRGGEPIGSEIGGTIIAKLSAMLTAGFDESKHPRADDGEFTSGQCFIKRWVIFGFFLF